MSKPIIIAVDAMGGDDSPNKIIAGISEYAKKKQKTYIYISIISIL